MNNQVNIEVKKGKALILNEPEIIEYAIKPIGKSLHEKSYQNKKNSNKKAHWSDRLECEICGKTFTRSARSKHNKTQYHLMYADLNKKFTKLLFNNKKK